jgi:hypothetical protein
MFLHIEEPRGPERQMGQPLVPTSARQQADVLPVDQWHYVDPCDVVQFEDADEQSMQAVG